MKILIYIYSFSNGKTYILDKILEIKFRFHQQRVFLDLIFLWSLIYICIISIMKCQIWIHERVLLVYKPSDEILKIQMVLTAPWILALNLNNLNLEVNWIFSILVIQFFIKLIRINHVYVHKKKLLATFDYGIKN